MIQVTTSTLVDVQRLCECHCSAIAAWSAVFCVALPNALVYLHIAGHGPPVLLWGLWNYEEDIRTFQASAGRADPVWRSTLAFSAQLPDG